MRNRIKRFRESVASGMSISVYGSGQVQQAVVKKDHGSMIAILRCHCPERSDSG